MPTALDTRFGHTALGDTVLGDLELPPPPALPAGHVPSAEPAVRRSRGFWLFAACAAGYSALGLVLMLKYDYHVDDAISRTANASYVLFSRYPHVAAVGFVWNPLPSLAEVPLLIFKPLWPALQTTGVAGALMSALFMAGAVVQLRNLLADHGARRSWTWVVTAAFALYPLVLLYGSDGLSEAPYLFFTLWAVSRVTRWMHTDDVRDLVVGGMALGFDFLARYEVVGIASCAAVLVAGTTYLRCDLAGVRQRVGRGVLDAVVLLVPFALSFVGWALAGWVITGSAFSQFSSVYGNSSQISVVSSTQHNILTSVALVVTDILRLEPLLPVVIVAVVYVAIRRGDLDALPALFLFGGGIGFVAASYVTGSTIANLRYYILSVPLLMVCAGLLPAAVRPSRWAVPAEDRTLMGNPAIDTRNVGTGWLADLLPTGFRLRDWLASDRVTDWVPTGWLVRLVTRVHDRPGRRQPGAGRLARRVGLVALAVALFVPAAVTTWVSMIDPSVDLSDYGVRSVVEPGRYPPIENDQIQEVPYGKSISSYLDSLHLPEGSVLVDSWEGFPIVVTSDDMKQFVITSDLDFVQVLNDPAAFGIRYMLDPSPTGVGVLDALNRRYPTLWRTGAGIATLVMEFQSPIKTLPSWKLYAVKGSS